MATYRALMPVAIQAQQCMDVVDLLRQLEEQHGPAPVPLYCSLISQLLKRPGRGTPATQAAYAVWQALRATRQRLDDVAYRTGMNLCVEMGRIDEARRLMDAMRGAGFRPGWGAYLILMKYHTQRNDMDGARKVFAQLRAYSGDQVLGISAYNTLLSGFVRQGDLTMARAVVDKARREGAAPDAYTYSCFAKGLVEAGRLGEAEGLLEEMAVEGLPPSPVVYGAVLDGCVRLNDWARAERIIARMRSAGHRPTVAHYNMLVRGRCYGSAYGPPGPGLNGGASSAPPPPPAPVVGPPGSLPVGAVNGGGSAVAPALSARSWPSSNGAEVGFGTGPFAAPMAAAELAASGSVDALMAEMRASGLRPDAVTYSTLVHGAVRSGSIDTALRVLAEMRMDGVQPDAAIFTSMMKLFREQGRQAQALEFFEQMSSSRSSAVDGWALSCLVAVYSSMGRMAEAEETVRRANHWAAEFRMPPPPEATYALLQGYGQQKRLRPALLAFRRFLAVGGRPHRKMCEFTYRLCLSQFDFSAAAQVLRAMRLMRGLQLREDMYRQLWQDAQRRLQARRPSSSGSDDDNLFANSQAEKWKWWLGLPNNYYRTDWR